MSRLWKWIDKKRLSNERKGRIFLVLNCLQYSILGFVVWLIVRNFVLSTWVWAFCFAGYSGFFLGYIGGFIFLCRKG